VLFRSNPKISDKYTAGYWARELLWNKRTIEESIEDIQSKSSDFQKYKVIYVKDGNITVFERKSNDFR